MFAEQRQAVGARATKARPCANPVQVGQIRQIAGRTAQHAREHRRLDTRVLRVELARRADQQLAGRPRLHVERDGRAVARVRARRIAELDELVRHLARVAVGDQQMALLRAQRQFGQQRARGDAVRDDDAFRAQRVAARERHARAVDRHRAVAPQRDARRALQQPARGDRRIENRVAGDLQRAAEPRAQHRLEPRERRRVDQLARDAMRGERHLLGAREVHLVGIGREPQRAAVAVRAAFRHFAAQRTPQRDRVMAQREFGRVVVHRDEVPHAGAGRAAARVVDDEHAQPALREFMRTCGTDDAGADYYDVGPGLAHDTMPQPNGSSSSISSVASALRCALPRIVGTMPPSACA
ncbi:hypothetical protein BamMEX5DRAFT_6127 [Burkholderia ambifaria MEX-5]|uniref:Uncharacterized protein n=1 Tax=Burkholderia ambifaria MEX-5 TaxID=396597 RepID=B1TEB1_9BURK|nr:hypothetical protein BamMEX5DRAFT_6127 [Burkholderia ambifaria MEX-5]